MKLLDITDNARQVYDLGHNPIIELTGYTEERLYIKGTGRLTLIVGDAVLRSRTDAFLVEGFDYVDISGGCIHGGIIGIFNKAYSIRDLVIHNYETGILINNGEWVSRIDIDNVIIVGGKGEGIYLGKSRSEKPHIKEAYITNTYVIDTEKDCIQGGAIFTLVIKDCVALSMIDRQWGHDKDIMINPNVSAKIENVTYKTIFVHPESQLNQV